ncbi:hypothetical protein M436DRAFT_85565 [Aureobasidium namibiae CBS 147.97]|uniref:F-box domain-containing protein n=1 Tax=Aureobasidium namibiae CBS 147.97 TaxID=1043004 RepID=A0A074W8S2_9PEZI
MNLPNQILKEICSRSELNRNDLRALRLTCKHLREMASQRFARECFKHITVLMSRPSLEAFIELARHPYYGSFVEKVNVSPIYDVMLSVSAFLPSGTSESTDTTEIATTYWNIRRELTKSRICESAEPLLGVAFKAFAQREQHLKLEFCDNERNVVGPRDALNNLALGQVSMWILDWTTAIERTINAVTSHGCTVTELSIHEGGLKRCVSEYSLHTDHFETPLGSLCTQLARLDICLYDDGIGSVSKSVKCMVSTARNLRFLNLERLCNWDDLEPQHYPEVLGCVLSQCLKGIVIGEFQISEQELLEFLGRQRDTLQNLQLLGGCLLEGSCMSLIAWIRDKLPSLAYLEFWEICDAHDHTDCELAPTRSYCVHRDEDMQACLADILNGKCEKKVKVKEAYESEQNEEDDEFEQEEINEPEQVEADDG